MMTSAVQAPIIMHTLRRQTLFKLGQSFFQFGQPLLHLFVVASSSALQLAQAP